MKERSPSAVSLAGSPAEGAIDPQRLRDPLETLAVTLAARQYPEYEVSEERGLKAKPKKCAFRVRSR
jgi:hypothetical protein